MINEHDVDRMYGHLAGVVKVKGKAISGVYLITHHAVNTYGRVKV
jgi:hypothetical protein